MLEYEKFEDLNVGEDCLSVSTNWKSITIEISVVCCPHYAAVALREKRTWNLIW